MNFHTLFISSLRKQRELSVPASILYKSIAGRYRPVSYPDGPITTRYRFIKNASWVQLPRNEAFDPGLPCLPLIQPFLNIIRFS